MGSATAALSGYGPQQVYVWLSYVSYDQSGNYSTWYWELYYKQNGGTQWASDPSHYWSLSGFAVGGPNYFGIPSSWAGGGDYRLGSGYFTKAHNSSGYLSAGTLTGSIVTTESSIGSGSAGVGSGTPPRIPKVPSAPPNAVFTSALPDRVNYTIAGPPDNGGSAVLDYDLRLYTLSGGVYTQVASKTSGSTAQFFDGLDPATTYYQRYRARNAVGYGAYSSYVAMTTESGIYVSDGTKWVGGGPKVSDGTNWINTPPTISDGDSWEDPLDV